VSQNIFVHGDHMVLVRDGEVLGLLQAVAAAGADVA
jgi:hypothetical protein